jgi:hypothetical protein
MYCYRVAPCRIQQINHQVHIMTKATAYVDHMYSQFEGRAAVTVGVNSGSESIHPFVYENKSQIPVGLIAMSVDDATDLATVDVYHISAFRPGNGQGSEIMKYLCNVADEFEVRLCIQPQAQFSGRPTLAGADLISWYRKFGFNGNGTMYREPEAS